jgi:hypothetical protein
MPRNVKDVSALLDRHLGSALGRPLSLLRTLVWAVLGVYLIGVVVPASAPRLHHFRALQDAPVHALMVDKNDPRGWVQPHKDAHAFRIAWIGGSTIQTVAPGHGGFLPADVLDRLTDIDQKPVTVDMYLMEASRIFDLYAVLAEAVATKPDLIVLDVNPLWVFNPNAVQEWNNLNGAALPHLVSRTGSWPLLGGLYSPRDVALSFASGHLSAIRDRWSFSQRLLHGVARLAPNPAAAPVRKPGAAGPTGVPLIASMQSPYSFWNYYRLSPGDTEGIKGYPAILRQARTDGSALNDDIVGQMLSMLGDSKIPAIAYVSAVDPATLDAPTDAALHRVEDHLRAIAAQHRAPNLFVQWQSGTRLVQGLTFRDMAHMTFDPPLANLLAATICRQLIAVDPATECHATPRTDP